MAVGTTVRHTEIGEDMATAGEGNTGQQRAEEEVLIMHSLCSWSVHLQTIHILLLALWLADCWRWHSTAAGHIKPYISGIPGLRHGVARVRGWGGGMAVLAAVGRLAHRLERNPSNLHIVVISTLLLQHIRTVVTCCILHNCYQDNRTRFLTALWSRSYITFLNTVLKTARFSQFFHPKSVQQQGKTNLQELNQEYRPTLWL